MLLPHPKLFGALFEMPCILLTSSIGENSTKANRGNSQGSPQCPPSWPCTMTVPWDGTVFPALNHLLLAAFIESVLCHLSPLII